MTSSWTVLDEAHSALRTTIAGITGADWALPTPCEQWNVAQVLRHASGDQLAYVAAITGSGGPTDNPFDPAESAPADPQKLLAAAIDSSARAFATVDPGAQAASPSLRPSTPGRAMTPPPSCFVTSAAAPTGPADHTLPSAD